MRILMLLPYYHPAIAYGGLVPLIHGFACELVQRGHEVVVYSTDALSASRRVVEGPAPVQVDGVRVHYFRNLSNRLAFGARAFLPVEMVGTAVREVGGFDVIHLHDFYTLPNVLVARLAARHRVPFVISPHGAYPPLPQRGRVLVKRLFLTLFGTVLLDRAARIVVTSEPERQHCVAAGQHPDRVVNVRSGVPEEALEPSPERGTFRRRFEIPSGAPVVLYFGRIDVVKGLDLLLPAFRNLDVEPVPHLILAGPDFGARAALERLAGELGIGARVHYTGLVADAAQKRQLMADADLFCLPSRSEGFPVSVLELMGAGLPGVISIGSNFPELESGGAGLVVPLEIGALSASLRRLVESCEMREHMGRTARAMVAREFLLAHVVDRLEGLYEGLTARGGAPHRTGAG